MKRQQWTCSACQAVNQETQHFCEACGVSRAVLASRPPEPPSAPREWLTREQVAAGFRVVYDVIDGRRTVEQAQADLEALHAGQAISPALPAAAEAVIVGRGRGRAPRPKGRHYNGELWWNEWRKTGVRPADDWEPA